jgi:hypothetical protein
MIKLMSEEQRRLSVEMVRSNVEQVRVFCYCLKSVLEIVVVVTTVFPDSHKSLFNCHPALPGLGSIVKGLQCKQEED